MNNFRMDDIFVFQTAKRIIFGNYSIGRIGEEAAANIRHGKKVLMITDKGVIRAGLTDGVVASLKEFGFDVITFDEVVPDPSVSLVLKCVELARDKRIDIILGIGGGSSIDTAKAASVMAPYEGNLYDCLGNNRVLKPGLPKIFVPTTAGTGSELGYAFILRDDQSGDKITSYTPFVLADLTIIDPTLTLTLPPKATAESGMDAFSHALESYVCLRANPMSDLFSLRAIELIAGNIKKAYANGAHNLEARYAMSLGSYFAVLAVRSSGLGITHAVCYPPSMKYHLAHGMAICAMMTSVMRYNLISSIEKYAAIAATIGERIEGLSAREAAAASVEAVSRLIEDVGMPKSLREINAKEEDFQDFADIVIKRYPLHIANNPRSAKVEDIRKIYELAL